MKKLLYTLLFFTYAFSSFAQDAPKKKIIKTYYQQMTRKGDLKDGTIKEEYQVLESDEEIRDGFYKKYDYDESLLIEGFYLNDEKNGQWKYYHNNGKIKEENNYKNDTPVGLQKKFDFDGKLLIQMNFNEEGNLDGSYKIINSDGICAINANFSSNMLNGITTFYYDDGKLRCKLSYKNNQLSDTAWSYYPNGNKMAFKFLKGEYVSHIEGYYENGIIKYIWKMTDSIEIKYTKKIFFASGKISYESIENDTLIFQTKWYDSKGNSLDNGTYLNGNGIMKSYNDDTLEAEVAYKDYLRDGLAVFYYSNGNKKHSVFYKNDKIDGDWYNYNIDGSLNYIGKKDESYSKNKITTTDYTDINSSYKGGPAQLMKYLSQNIRYPSLARENGLEGKIIVKFAINSFGDIKDVKILKDGVGGGCAEESIRVIKNMPPWNPSYFYGFPLNTEYVLPVTFKLQ